MPIATQAIAIQPVAVQKMRGSHVLAALALVLIAVIRIVASYAHTAQAFDEPTHIGAAMEFLDKGTYASDPVHPPLARIAIGLPLYLAGERYPADPFLNVNGAGNAILNGGGRYRQNLELARLGVLPFFLLACVVVFFWSRQEYGDFAALMALALFTTLPNILAFSSIAYTDIVAASTQVAALWAAARWLERPTGRSTLGMGFAAGLALLAKATTCIYLPACGVAMVLAKWAVGGDFRGWFGKRRAGEVLLAGIISVLVVWAGYGFAIGNIDESMGLSPASMPSFQHFPAAVGRLGRSLMFSNPRIPAPALVRGMATAWVLNQTHPPAYLLGHIREGGWWYFFLVGVAVKSTIPLLVLTSWGVFCCRSIAREGRGSALVPATCILAILLVTMPVKYNAGVRHVLVVFPLMAIVAGCGCSYMWSLGKEKRLWAMAALIGLLSWQLVATVGASDDFLAYFNPFAGSDPSQVMVAGCDLDCGQDLFALERELRNRHISQISLALWTSTDMSKTDLPKFAVPQPYQPVAGWFAISWRALRLGDLFHTTYPPDAFGWLSRYQPVAHVGKTILLYYIPQDQLGRSTE
jgi:hypothetical protein